MGYLSPTLAVRNVKGSFRGAKPLSHNLPLSFEGEGDTGGEVDKKPCERLMIYVNLKKVHYEYGYV